MLHASHGLPYAGDRLIGRPEVLPIGKGLAGNQAAEAIHECYRDKERRDARSSVTNCSSQAAEPRQAIPRA